jgi:hypothetical protein
MWIHTLMHAASHRISISGPHMRSYGRILKQWTYCILHFEKLHMNTLLIFMCLRKLSQNTQPRPQKRKINKLTIGLNWQDQDQVRSPARYHWEAGRTLASSA